MNRQFQLDAFGETLLLFAAAARHDRLSQRALAGGRGQPSPPSRPAGSEPDAGVWELAQRALGPFSARPAWPACGRSPPRPRRPGGQVEPARRRHPRRRRRRLRPPERPVATGARRPTGRRRPAAARHPGRAARRGPAQPGHPGGGAWRTEPAMDSPTGSATTIARSGRPKGRFLLCGFWVALATHQLGPGRRGHRPASSATGPRAGRPAC